MKPEIQKHSWDEKIIKQFGNDRCEKCGMQYEYYQSNLATLKAWTNKEIEQEPQYYKKLVKSFEECHGGKK